jgi:NAD(P)H dehydrogenase (quinone)
MNIGIIVYSQTGHTLEVCGKLKDRFIGEGHSVSLEQVTVAGDRVSGARISELENRPDPSPYDAVVFAAHVEAFSLCPVMDRYLRGIEPIEGKKVGCLVTQQFPYPWMGGSRAIRQMARLCRAKGAMIRTEAVVNWAKSRRDKTMAAAITRVGKAL